MTTLRAWIIFATIALGGGCALFAPANIPVSQTLSDQAQAVQKAINESNVLLIASANVVKQELADGILTKTEAQAYVAKLKDYAGKVDNAQVLLRSGDILNAKTQAELMQRLLIALHKEIAQRARK